MATLHADAGSGQRASSAAAESTYREGDRETGKETSIETGKKGETEEHGGWQRDRYVHALFGHIPRRGKEREREAGAGLRLEDFLCSRNRKIANCKSG